jgi:hypothetical protein
MLMSPKQFVTNMAALATVSFSVVGIAACGGSSGGAGSLSKRSASAGSGAPVAPAGASAAKSPHENDPDQEEDRSGRDRDDKLVWAFGKRATARETRLVGTLVRSYYRAVATQDGSGACSLLYSPLAESVPEDYGRPPGPASLRGGTCAVVMSKLFKQRHRQIAGETAGLRLAQVRVKGNQGLALLAFGRNRSRQLLLHREHGVWKVWALLDSEIP